MKFFCVFCVVLYLQSGASLQPRNNEFSQIYQQQQNKGNEQFYSQRNAGIVPNLAYNFNRNPSEVNLQRQMAIEQQTLRGRKINDLRQRESIGLRAQDFSPQYKAQLFERNNQPVQQENNLLVTQQTENLNIQPIRELENLPITREVESSIKQNMRPDLYEFPKISFIRKDNEPSLKSDEGVRLELQGVSSEYIKSLIDKQNILKQNPHETLHLPHSSRNIEVENLKYLPTQPNYEKYQTLNVASFQNPSAESVYKLGRALPYRINPQQFSNTPQASTYLQNILTNSKQIQDIYASKQPTKRYTVVYPDGKIEHIDQIESVLASNPNYVLIKAEDVMRHIQSTSNVTPGLQVPNVKQNSPVKPEIISTLESTVINKENNGETNISPNSQIVQKLPVFNNSTLFKENSPVPLSKIPFKKAIDKPNLISASDSKIESSGSDMISKNKTISTLTTNNIEKNQSSTLNDTTIVENAKEFQLQNITDLIPPSAENQTVTASNVLLNTFTPTLETVNNRSNFTVTAIDTTPTRISNESITLTSTQDDIKNESDDIKNETVIDTTPTLISNESITLTNTKDNIKNESDSIKNETVIDTTPTRISNESITLINKQDNIKNESDDIKNESVIDTTPTRISNESITFTNEQNDIKSESDDIKNETVIGTMPISISNESITLTSTKDNTKNESDTRIPEKNSDIFLSPSSIPLTNNGNTTENSAFWFQPDEYFWDKLINENNTQNIYFLFVPHKQITEKDTKTTIYQNGTTVEEIIEIITDDGGVPKISKTTTVTQNNNTNIYSDD